MIEKMKLFFEKMFIPYELVYGSGLTDITEIQTYDNVITINIAAIKIHSHISKTTFKNFLYLTILS
ncbi:Uncharacterised protein [Mesomycoplasma neurolyticum]|uniref:Uncharacterized protein n=2 Tax=Mesomycoplasma neurolyticum TaxID=2120 RepID=A0A449A4S1_9BACT|nr:Uncharacterised protein [Mesomycoplasma neurolyticum]